VFVFLAALGALKAHGLCAAGEGVIMKVVLDVEGVNMNNMSTIAEEKKAGKIIDGDMKQRKILAA
jgi:hypothetical protein